jgi:serine/threonine protein phosphatase PrpC/predicted Ser/Thr protein kinase
MPTHLKISLGQHSDKGRKETNQDFHGAYIPTEPQLSSKGIAIALADGISTSNVSRIAAQATVKGFLEDYYCTSQAWSVKTSAQRVLTAINSWLHSQSQQSQYRNDMDRGYVCTLSALVLKSTTAHLFHVGDTRIYRMHAGALEQLTKDHRVWVSQDKSYLGRALGVDSQVEIDYRAVPIEPGDTFILATDGVYESVATELILATLEQHRDDLDAAARAIVAKAIELGSRDNLTLQIVRIDELPAQDVREIRQQLTELPFPPELQARMDLDGYRIVRELHSSHRSHIYLATDGESGAPVVIKTPSVDLRGDPAYLERFAMEEWIAQRIDSPYVLKAHVQARKRNYLYVVTEFVEGQTLAQWMIDHDKPALETVRDIAEQVARGLQAFHRLEMLHQDVRPQNVMIDRSGTVKIIDFGSTRVAGVAETVTTLERTELLGTAQYTAPEYFLGEPGTTRSDVFSLGVIVYQMLTGRLPYGAEVAKCRTRAAQRRLVYRSVLADDREIPAWIDEVLKKATHIDPNKRYDEVAELVHDLRHPSATFLRRARVPLIERNPVVFWKTVSFALLIIVLALLMKLS